LTAIIARQRREQDLHLILLDQLAHGAHGGVGRRVGRRRDELELFVADLLAQHIERGLVAAHAILAEHGIGAFERRSDADPDLLLGKRGA
jgi:hypothetical protein